MEALAGGVTGATATFIVALIIFCILRSKRRHRVVRFTSDLQASTSSDVRDQHLSQSAQSYTTPRPFLDFPSLQNCSSSKEIITDGARNPSVQNQGNIELAVDPFGDPIPTEGSLLNNDDEGQRVRNALDHLQELTSRFERELQQLCILAQSGQLSAEDRLKLEEIRRATNLTIHFDPGHDNSPIGRSTSSGSSVPPSYRTNGT